MGLRFRRSFGLGSKGLRNDIGTGNASGSPYSSKFGRKHQGRTFLVLVTGGVLGFVLYMAFKVLI